ncbi:hypothetical protein QFZ57_002985 [Arthrobacter sp. B1I2]|nr:hypothetical protein [Arthrobacter sp. B1I2]
MRFKPALIALLAPVSCLTGAIPAHPAALDHGQSRPDQRPGPYATGITATLAEYERELINERVRAG